MGVSIASRVVPGTGLTMARSCPQNRVKQRALAHVRPAHNGDLDRLVDFLGPDRLERRDHGIQQIAGALSVQRRDRVHLTQTQLVKLHGVLAAFGVVGFIRRDKDRRPRLTIAFGLEAAQNGRHFAIGGSEAAFAIDHKDHRV